MCLVRGGVISSSACPCVHIMFCAAVRRYTNDDCRKGAARIHTRRYQSLKQQREAWCHRHALTKLSNHLVEPFSVLRPFSASIWISASWGLNTLDSSFYYVVMGEWNERKRVSRRQYVVSHEHDRRWRPNSKGRCQTRSRSRDLLLSNLSSHLSSFRACVVSHICLHQAVDAHE